MLEARSLKRTRLRTCARTRARGLYSGANVNVAYQYDANGALLKDGLRSYEFDAAEKLGFQYFYDEEGSLLAEVGTGGANSSGTSLYFYLPTPSGPLPIAAITGGAGYAVHTDHLNTPRRLSNASKQAAWQWAYSAFGDEQPTIGRNRYVDPATTPNAGTTTMADVVFNLRYPGQYFDKESNLHYNYFRSYDSRTGRYSQSDPIGLDGGWNRFVYADGDGINSFDPYGLAACQVTFPNMPIDTGLGFSSANLGGHGGILTYDSKGATQYHEYGRYPASQATGVGLPADEGNVRRVGMPNLKFDKNGQPTPESMEALRKALQGKAGKGTSADLTCDADADEKKIRDYIKRIAEDANRAKYSWKPWSSNQCRDFANRAFNAGK
jgi:RHS repeat-associated protein